MFRRILQSSIGRRFSTAAPAGSGGAAKATGSSSGGGGGSAGKIVGGAIAALFGGAAIAVYGAPDWTLKQIIDIAKPKIKSGADVDLEFGDVKGSLSLFPPSADITFSKLHVVRPIIADKKQSAFDLVFDTFKVTAAVGSLTGSVPTVSSVAVNGMAGAFIRHPDSPPLPAVTFKSFSVANANIRVSTIGGAAAMHVPVTLKSFLTSGNGLSLHQLPISLAQSTIEGTIAARPFVLKPLTGGLKHGSKAQWSIQALPLSVLSPLAPAGSPLEWIGSGVTDINVQTTYDQPDPKQPYQLRIENLFAISDVRAAVPSGAPPLIAVAAAPVVSYLNSFSGGKRLAVGPLQYSFSQTAIEAVNKTNPELQHMAKYFVADLGQKIEEKAKKGITDAAQEVANAGWASFTGWLNDKTAAAAAPAPAPPAPIKAAAAKPPSKAADQVD